MCTQPNTAAWGCPSRQLTRRSAMGSELFIREAPQAALQRKAGMLGTAPLTCRPLLPASPLTCLSSSPPRPPHPALCPGMPLLPPPHSAPCSLGWLTQRVSQRETDGDRRKVGLCTPDPSLPRCFGSGWNLLPMASAPGKGDPLLLRGSNRFFPFPLSFGLQWLWLSAANFSQPCRHFVSSCFM